MSRRIILAGLAALLALAFSAFSASGASAAEAVTCVEAPTTAEAEFKDPHCVEPGHTAAGPNYKHVAFGSTPTQLTLHSASEFQFLKAELFGTAVTLRGTGVECIDCMAENSGGVVKGSGGQLRYTGVEVVGHAGCTVVDDENATGSGKGTADQITTTPLKFETTGTSTAVIKPVNPPVLAHINITNVGGCPGALTRTVNVEGEVNGTTSGATLKVETGAGELEIEEEPAFLEGEATMTAGETGSTTHHPVALT